MAVGAMSQNPEASSRQEASQAENLRRGLATPLVEARRKENAACPKYRSSACRGNEGRRLLRQTGRYEKPAMWALPGPGLRPVAPACARSAVATPPPPGVLLSGLLPVPSLLLKISYAAFWVTWAEVRPDFWPTPSSAAWKRASKTPLQHSISLNDIVSFASIDSRHGKLLWYLQPLNSGIHTVAIPW